MEILENLERSWIHCYFPCMPPYDTNWRSFGPDLGAGGQGTAKRVIEKGDPFRHGVVKSLRGELVNDAMARRRFFREARILGSIQHVGVPRLIDDNVAIYNNPAAELYYITDFVGGLALHKYIGSTNYSAEECLRFAIRLLRVVEYLHGLTPPVIHRDIKPQNILARGKIDPVLIDFGIAFRLGIDDQMGLTEGEDILGNAFLRLPGNRRDPRMDVAYCCGILFYLLSHTMPGVMNNGWQGSNHANNQGLLTVIPMSAADRAAAIDIFQRGFAVDQNERFQSAAELRESIEAMLNALETVAPETILARSALNDYIPRPKPSRHEQFQIEDKELTRLLLNLVERMNIPEEEVETLTYISVLERAAELESLSDDQPVIEPAKLADIRELMELCEGAPEDDSALDNALVFYPAIIAYVRERIDAHEQAEYAEAESWEETMRDLE